MIVADANHTFELTGNGDVLEPSYPVIGKKFTFLPSMSLSLINCPCYM